MNITEKIIARASDKDRVAQILIDAAYLGDRATASKWGISLRTVQRYWQRAETEPELTQAVSIMKEKREAEWAGCLTDVIFDIVQFLKLAAQNGDTRDPDMVAALDGALQTVADVKLTKEMLDARIAKENGRSIETDGQAAWQSNGHSNGHDRAYA